VLEEFRDVIANSQAQVKCDALPALNTSPALLRMMLHNLVGNALKFQAEGKVPDIEVSALHEGDFWVFSVRDNGLGVDPAFHDHVFTSFKRYHRNDDYPGTGIGLSTCRKFVRLAGGDIGFDSVHGQGATFWFSLPANVQQGKAARAGS
jgi:light-regulated signal transduction histidine kinase (bacteriophytochrome)